MSFSNWNYPDIDSLFLHRWREEKETYFSFIPRDILIHCLLPYLEAKNWTTPQLVKKKQLAFNPPSPVTNPYIVCYGLMRSGALLMSHGVALYALSVSTGSFQLLSPDFATKYEYISYRYDTDTLTFSSEGEWQMVPDFSFVYNLDQFLPGRPDVAFEPSSCLQRMTRVNGDFVVTQPRKRIHVFPVVPDLTLFQEVKMYYHQGHLFVLSRPNYQAPFTLEIYRCVT